jgi:6-phosphogluconolactonase
LTEAPFGTLEVVEDEHILTERLAEHFVARASEAIAQRGYFHVALAGGSTPQAAYALLAREPFRSQLDWTAVHFYFGDERCVPPNHPDSNYRMVQDALFDSLGISQERIHRMHGEDPPESAALAYAELLRSKLGIAPRFDLILLGMGPDAHTASLFPGSPLPAADILVAARYISKLATWRLTLTPTVILNARSIVVAAAGQAKAEALAHAFDPHEQAEQYPIQILRRAVGDLAWLVDQRAASGISKI